MKVAILLLAVSFAGCSSDSDTTIAFGAFGPLAGDAGKASFRFGVASAATQIEDQDVHTDWYQWTSPTASGGQQHGQFIDQAAQGYTRAMEDLGRVRDLGVDSYRFSIEWARIEPAKDQLDEAAIAHYRDQLVAMHAMGIHPVVTLHHFSNPIWIEDARFPCPSDQNLCGLGAENGAQVIAQMAEHAALVADRFGDLVDEWGTLNEPVNYLLAAYGIGTFPPGRVTIAQLDTLFIPVVRDYLAAHAAMYHAIKLHDTVDADGDGVAASVGLSLSVADWQASRFHQPSSDPEDVSARDRLIYLFHYLVVDSVTRGTFDANLDGTADEQHPDWASTLDWLGVQYYFRSGVTGASALIPLANLTPCFGDFDGGACLPAPDPTYCVPRMGYEGWTDGIHDILVGYHARYPTLPLVVSEAGIATDTGKRRAENIVRVLEAIARARDEGVDVRGYYHWSLTDNFEWAEGFGPHFGLYRVDYASYARTATEGADVLKAIATARSLSAAQRATYGGTGPMTPEAGFDSDPFCRKVSAPNARSAVEAVPGGNHAPVEP